MAEEGGSTEEGGQVGFATKVSAEEVHVVVRIVGGVHHQIVN